MDGRMKGEEEKHNGRKKGAKIWMNEVKEGWR